MVEIYKYWIGQAGFDGFRIDTVKHGSKWASGSTGPAGSRLCGQCRQAELSSCSAKSMTARMPKCGSYNRHLKAAALSLSIPWLITPLF